MSNQLDDAKTSDAVRIVDPSTGMPCVVNADGSLNSKVINVVQTLDAIASSATLTIKNLPATTDTMLLAANPNRKSVILFIPKAGISIKYGSGASATSFTRQTPLANTEFIITGYTGQINAFGAATTINVTELI